VLNTSSILNVFAKSPIRPLRQHMETVYSCCQTLIPFIESAKHADFVSANRLYNEISEAERKADSIKQDLRTHLPRSIFLPVPRSDVLDLLATQDVLANKTKDIAGIMLGRQMAIPEEISHNFTHFIAVNVGTCAKAKSTIDQLEELLESGFRGKETALVEDMVKEIDELEAESDQLQVKLRASLFAIEDSLSPVNVIFLYKIIQWVGEIADAAQSVAHRLLLLASS
jgi:predicted phosphate transport protein (TIGR00153 family)